MKIAVIGVGHVGAPLADHLQRLGHDVTIAARDPDSQSVCTARQRNPQLGVKAPLEAVTEADVVFLATPFRATVAALGEWGLGGQSFSGLYESRGSESIPWSQQ